MTPRERLLAVYCGRKPDCVASLADLSYWRAGNGGGKFIPGKTNGANFDVVEQLLELHRQTRAAIHLNVGCFYNVRYEVEQYNAADAETRAGIDAYKGESVETGRRCQS